MSTYVSSQIDWGKTSRRTRVTSLCSRPASSSVSCRPRCFSNWARAAPVSALLARDRPTSNKPDVNITFTSSRYGLTETWPLSPQAAMTETNNIPAHTGIRRVQHAAIRLRIRITRFSVAPRVRLSLVALARSEYWTPRRHPRARHQRLPIDEAGLPSRLLRVDRRVGHLHPSLFARTLPALRASRIWHHRQPAAWALLDVGVVRLGVGAVVPIRRRRGLLHVNRCWCMDHHRGREPEGVPEAEPGPREHGAAEGVGRGDIRNTRGHRRGRGPRRG